MPISCGTLDINEEEGKGKEAVLIISLFGDDPVPKHFLM
jgi:hypothetical protein